MPRRGYPAGPGGRPARAVGASPVPVQLQSVGAASGVPVGGLLLVVGCGVTWGAEFWGRGGATLAPAAGRPGR